jgi:hypothetical protein
MMMIECLMKEMSMIETGLYKKVLYEMPDQQGRLDNNFQGVLRSGRGRCWLVR